MLPQSYKQYLPASVALLMAAFFFSSCKSDTTSTTDPLAYQATVLVSDTAGFGAARTDPNLLNAWGIAVLGDGSFVVAANHDSSALRYDRTGQSVGDAIAIPAPDHATGGSPSGAIVNTTSDFNGAKVIFATEDGILATWSGGSSATKVTTPGDSTSFKGLAIASVGTVNYVYATDFMEDKVIVFDKNFQPVGITLSDPAIPSGISGYGPFGIANIGGMLYVTYAHHKPFPDNGDDLAGAGNGYVDVFNPNGTLVKRFATQGTLNSPWAVTMAGSGFGSFKNAILIGNFGDGAINAFDQNGSFLGQITDKNGTPILIKGLWGLSFNLNAGDPNFLYFASGPDEESHGTFGYIQLK
ncbi:MAG: TIGR03118 family protein [Bacteroidota bacterium]|nr:TIGR03118 family protein [Bacteroidota bacterium]MDP4232329.1 TIGR03118 family protein [Bacteroidota bacterium]MDP4241468.1 TIGR03118 family protein [Bacteroidota bacterium]MDP4286708.1 TIGR03118 family protein [Bacteroidota bacterium]